MDPTYLTETSTETTRNSYEQNVENETHDENEYQDSSQTASKNSVSSPLCSNEKMNTTRKYNKPLVHSGLKSPEGVKFAKPAHSKTRKRIIDPAISFVKSLYKLYPNTVKQEYDTNVVCNGTQFPQYNYVYGEINYDGIEKMYKVLMSMFFDDYVFIDLGSGNGKVALYLASKQQIVRSFGIELVKERFDFSVSLLNKLKKRSFFQFIQKIHLYNQDMFSIDYSKIAAVRNEPTLKSIVWMSNLCFKEEHTKEILEKLSGELEDGSLVCFSKIPEDIINKPLVNAKTLQHNTRIKNTDFLFVRSENIGMSWNKDHSIHIFIKSTDDFEEEDDEEEEEEEEEVDV